jgi:hypothetical protein
MIFIKNRPPNAFDSRARVTMSTNSPRAAGAAAGNVAKTAKSLAAGDCAVAA